MKQSLRVCKSEACRFLWLLDSVHAIENAVFSEAFYILLTVFAEQKL